jgi:tRNA(His) 5'-end guanylyltransferase
MMKKDALGDRIKGQYENRTRVMLPRRTYTIIRVDGKAFHTFTRHCEKPNDSKLASALDIAALALCEEAQGACFAYVQSDEISVLLTDFAKPTTDAWFDGNLQKIASVSASVVTATFAEEYPGRGRALFDARVFVIPDPVEVENYFIWRQQDATRNSIQGLAQAHFSPSQCHGLNTSELQERLFSVKGINWNDTEAYWKRGRCVLPAVFSSWQIDRDIPVFTADREYLSSRVLRQWARLAPEVSRDE